MVLLFNSDDVQAAKESEMNNWRINEVYDKVENMGHEVISVRCVVTEKMNNWNNLIKARLVARGFEEDTGSLRKDSPTCSKESVRLAIAIAVSKGWICHTVDIKAAYLQGSVIQHVFLKPQPEYFNGKLWKLKKTVYGLCDAARAWYLRVKEELLRLKVTASSIEPATFSWKNDDLLEGIICVYVDDFLWAGTKLFEAEVIGKISDMFLIGGAESRSFMYVGLNVVSSCDGAVSIDQWQYIASLKL